MDGCTEMDDGRVKHLQIFFLRFESVLAPAPPLPSPLAINHCSSILVSVGPSISSVLHPHPHWHAEIRVRVDTE